MSNVPDILRSAKAVLAEGGKVTGHYIRDKQCCMIGALARIIDPTLCGTDARFCDIEKGDAGVLLRKVCGDVVSIYSDTHTLQECLVKFDEAIALAEAT